MNESLFQAGDFVLASGQKSRWKIECDALTPDDWDGLALMLMERLYEPFSEVFGVPRGGVPFADALRPYVTEGANRLLVVDDVWTTGGSINRFSQDLARDRAFSQSVDRAVAFARGPAPLIVTRLFQMTPPAAPQIIREGL